ncbi:unnamed protein product [Caenorhabditis auriculariae]|uniref:Uncharacterized protein n=1 Tax=Caenorhabditis auriculariae TaxID=2777116 RepID=A0A8S1GMN9_9PELO|nr:unnamed protein product [Caenorhabditis auriculariae]
MQRPHAFQKRGGNPALERCVNGRMRCWQFFHFLCVSAFHSRLESLAQCFCGFAILELNAPTCCSIATLRSTSSFVGCPSVTIVGQRALSSNSQLTPLYFPIFSLLNQRLSCI